MTEVAIDDAGMTASARRLGLLLAMAMFVLVVDTSLMNVSISAVVHDLNTTVSGVQSAIALEALVSAAFILIGSKIGDLFGRKRAYVLGLLGYAVGALAMALAQSLTAIIIFWAILGGLGASLLLPAMQSLIHGNFEGAAQRRVYALVGRLGRDRRGGRAAARRVHHDLPLVAGRVRARGRRHRDRAVRACGWSRTCRTRVRAAFDLVGSVLSVIGMGGIVLGILVWQEGGEAVGPADRARRDRHGGAGVVARPARSVPDKPTLIDPDLFSSKLFRLGISGQMLQQIALGGTMIALPIYLQMVLEYNALQAGLSIAPLSLSMFAVALVAGRRAGRRRPAAIIRAGFLLLVGRPARAAADHPSSRQRLVARRPADHRRLRARPARVAAEQLHAVADLRGAGQRGRRRQLGRRVVRALVRAGVRGRDHARRRCRSRSPTSRSRARS